MKHSKMRDVVVLLSTFNGAKYLSEQIESIMRQKEVNITLLIRDDCSTDETKKILDSYAERYNNIQLLHSLENLGPAFSFLRLVKNAPLSDYYALSDQDDVWDDDKLINAIHFMENENREVPILYHSNVRIVDEKLNIIRNGNKQKDSKNKYSAILENNATGCTMVFNNKLREIINLSDPSFVSMHDSWIYLIAMFFGVVIFDDSPHISYRQHGNNVIGANTNIFKKFSKKIKRIFNLKNKPRLENATSFYNCYSQYFDEDTRKQIQLFIDYKKTFKNKLSLLKNKNYKSERFLKNIEYKILILLGTF